jgi:hypothetical protein
MAPQIVLRREERFMHAVVSNARKSDFIVARNPAFAADARETMPRPDDGKHPSRAMGALALIIGRMCERRRRAEIARRSSPLSLDDAWAGAWYARSRLLQQTLLQQRGPASMKLAPPPLDWDDKLD